MAGERISRGEAEARFYICRCRLIIALDPGFELWETGWGLAFTLKPDGDGAYDEWQIERLLQAFLEEKPPDWEPYD